MAELDRVAGAGVGWFAFLTGALALLGAVTVFWAGPFAPQQAASVGLGEMAAEIAKSAARSAVGMEQPAPEARVRDIDDYLQIAVGGLGAVAVILGVAGISLRGGVRPSVGGVTLGGMAIAFQFFAFYAMALLGVFLIMAVIYSLKDVFGDIFSF